MSQVFLVSVASGSAGSNSQHLRADSSFVAPALFTRPGEYGHLALNLAITQNAIALANT